ncbi:MAG TPA: hypothetical protein VF244_10905 [Acidimicrobiales bacterium]
MAVTTDTIRRVQEGADWLDVYAPGWLDLVDLARLAMDDCTACILGQVFANRVTFDSEGHSETGYDAGYRLGADMYALGFNDPTPAGLEDLHEAWAALITERRIALITAGGT